MKLQFKVALAFVITSLWIQPSFCDGSSGSLNKWICRCSFQGNQSSSLANCSTSCDCRLDVKDSASLWTCLCDPNGFPYVEADGHSSNCFTACNCSWGALTISQGSKKHVSIKIVIIILLLCVICTTVAFLASIICYVYQRDRCPIQSPILSSDNGTSYNSTAILISNRTSVSETKAVTNSTINPISGCFQMASFLCGSKEETFHGNIIQFSFAVLENATDKFSASNLIGLGRSSYVYCGRMKSGTNVAVKRIKAQGGTEADSEFLTEIELLSRLHHCHLVPLLGYCLASKGRHVERLLVFKYMANGNLRDCLDGVSGRSLDWATRVKVAMGAARGLEYLHEAAAPKILHRDVKSTNILLDENYQAKITDLGMAKNLRADDFPSRSNSPARMQGTFGYFAPEYAIVGRASLKSDIFSFGVVLLEIISGRHPIYKSRGREESLVIWAAPLLQDKRRIVTELADPQLNGNFPEKEMQIMAYLAKECLLLDPDTRPTMSEVVQILSTISPDKSKRTRNIPVNLFQEPKSSEKLKQAPSCKVDIDHNLWVGNLNYEADIVSAEYTDSLAFVTSKAESWYSSEEEIVDLAEPRYESFCVTNVSSSS